MSKQVIVKPLKWIARNALPRTNGESSVARMVRRLRARAFQRPLPRADATTRNYSQYGQDVYVAKYLRGMRGGVFLDIGAHDGVSYSNTCLLEREFEWTGICVEPNPEAFRRLRAARGCVCINAAASAAEGSAKFVQFTGYGEMLSGLSSTVNSSRVTEATAVAGVTVSEIEVRCELVGSMLKAHGIAHVDYVSIDTEGGEFDIVRTMDLRQLRVKILTIENNGEEDKIEPYMRAQGYRLRSIIGSDSIYVDRRL